MLVLTRREGESLFIGDDLEVVILRTGLLVSIGINAPPNVAIVRS